MTLLKVSNQYNSNSRRLLRRLVFEWSLIVLVTLGLLWWLSGTHSLQLANLYAYDRVLSSHERMGDSDIVVVAIDEDSLDQLGRWPWRRSTHAAFLDKLSQAEPKGILLDVLFVEPAQEASDDKVLAKSAKQTPNLVLPLLLMPTSERVGLDGGFTWLQPIFGDVATGQISVGPDLDGVVRRTRLRFEQNGQSFDALGLKLLMLGESASSRELIEQRVQDVMRDGGQYTLPLNVSKGGYMTVSYRSILDGEVSADFLRNKYVLVGATALGLGDQFTTPASGLDGTVSGVEIHAILMDGLKNGLVIKTVDAWYWLALPIVLLMLSFLVIKERFHLWVFLAVLFIFFALVLGLMWSHYVWIPPVLTTLGLFWVYLLWSWRRLAVVVRYAETEWQDVSASAGSLLPLLTGARSTRFAPHALDLNMDYTHRLHALVSDSLLHFPSALLIIDDAAVVRFHNQEAAAILARINPTYALNTRVHAQAILTMLDGQALLWPEWQSQTGFDWLDGRELSGIAGVFSVHVVAVSKTDASQANAWLVNLLELTAERHAQRTRADLVKFLSHDLRTPQVAILAVLDLYPNESASLREEVAYHVHRTLGWANDMVELTQAQNDELQISEANLASLAQEVVDELYSVAQSKKIKVELNDVDDVLHEALWIQADSKLIQRAVMNLITNAIRYSPDGTQIWVTVSASTGYVALAVKDQGVGMSPQKLAALCQESQMRIIDSEKHTDAAGSLGIGLNMVKAVMQRHKGELRIESELGKGSIFTLILPVP